jgi:LuxR family transcriptional regulator, quorum-sensing system regulator CviR
MTEFSSRLRHHVGSDVGALSDIMHESAFCSTRDELLSVISRAQSVCGFESAILALVKDCGQSHYQVAGWVNHSYPLPWLAIYQREDFSKIDPVILSHGGNPGTRRWSDAYSEYPPPRFFLSAARDHGLCDGWTTGLCHRRRQESSLLSFSWGRKVPEERQGVLLHLVAPHLHQALVRILEGQESDQVGELTPKEIEVLKWIRQGKSNWEISAILKISERTVKFHVGNLLSKLNAVNRGHAVALAFERGL